MGYTCGRILDKKFCQSIASTCSSISEFHKTDHCAYEKSLKMGWLDEWFGRLVHKPYTQADCYEIAKQCSSRSEFKHKSYSAWKTAKRHGWIETYNWFRTTAEIRKDIKVFTDNDVIESARKYTHLSIFRQNEPSRYTMASRRGLLSKMRWLKRNVEVMNRKCLDCVYAYEFSDYNTVYVGRTVEPHRRNLAHHKPNDSVAQFAMQTNTAIPQMKILHDGITYKEGALIEALEMDNYKNNGWKLLNKAPAGSIGGLGARKLNKTYCISIASKYTTLSDLICNNGSVYNALRVNGWLNECKWLKYQKKPRGYWCNKAKAELLVEASKYQTRNEFMHRAKTVYEIVRRNGWMDEVFPIRNKLPAKVENTVPGANERANL